MINYEENQEKKKRNSIYDKRKIFEIKKKDSTPKEITNNNKNNENLKPIIEETKTIDDSSLTESSVSLTEPSVEPYENRKRVFSIKDKISMFSQTGAVPKKVLKSEDLVSSKSQYIKVIDETTKKLKWTEAPKIIETLNEQLTKNDENSTISVKLEEAKNEHMEEEKKESDTQIIPHNTIQEDIEENTSDEKCVDIVINENDDTMIIQEKLKENIEERKAGYNSYFETSREIKQQSNSFNLQEEIEKSDTIENNKIDSKSDDIANVNNIIPVSNNLSLNKSINQKLRNINEKRSQENTIIMYDYSSNKSERKNFNNYAQIKQYITGNLTIKTEQTIQSDSTNERNDCNIINNNVSSSNLETQSIGYANETSLQVKKGYNDNYFDADEKNNANKTMKKDKLEINLESKRSYEILNNDSLNDISRENITKFFDTTSREKSISKAIIQIVQVYYDIKSKFSFKLFLVIVILLLLFILLFNIFK